MRSRRGHIHITPVENHSILTSRGTKSSINDSRKTTKDLIACHFKEKFKDKDNSSNCVWNNQDGACNVFIKYTDKCRVLIFYF